MTSVELIAEVKKLRQGVGHPSPPGLIAGKDKSDSGGTGTAGVHQRVRQVSAVTGTSRRQTRHGRKVSHCEQCRKSHGLCLCVKHSGCVDREKRDESRKKRVC